MIIMSFYQFITEDKTQDIKSNLEFQEVEPETVKSTKTTPITPKKLAADKPVDLKQDLTTTLKNLQDKKALIDKKMQYADALAKDPNIVDKNQPGNQKQVADFKKTTQELDKEVKDYSATIDQAKKLGQDVEKLKIKK
jgi:hypothetical protein